MTEEIDRRLGWLGRCLLYLIAACLVLLGTGDFPGLLADEQPDRSPSFDSQVLPILQKCIGCHGPDRPKGDLSLTEPTGAIELGAIVPHEPESSSLVERITSNDPDVRMPPSESLSPQEIDILQRWIEAGAAWPTHWAYRRLSAPELPSVSESMQAWCLDPIDRFVASRLQSNNLTPSPMAEKRTLLRRVYYDLVGVPPTHQEVVQFQNDSNPDAYQQVVERLLASPQYGERWTRHWMDIVHFAESHGHDQDRPREHAWPYRDYLIRRFNEDVSYPRFIQEQIAGDRLYPEDAWSIVATGFLAAGPWDESSLMSVQEDSIDREVGRYLDRDDIVTTVLSTFASTSIHCARCHHHKFDPITQDEYFGLQAVFSGIDKANRKFDWDPAVAAHRQRLKTRLGQVDSWLSAPGSTSLPDEIRQAVASWEDIQRASVPPWSSVKLAELKSGSGQTLQREADNSIFVDGPRADKDRYEIELKSELKETRSIRLTVLADERLPSHGPGRHDNGNFHLNEIRIFEINSEHPEWQRQLAITRAASDFDQAGWTIANCIDGNLSTAWGIHPQVGQNHYAVFEFEPSQSSMFRIELDQVHGANHVIGRLAIDVSDRVGLRPSQSELPVEIVAILETQAELRTHEQRIQLAAFVERERIHQELASLPAPAMVYCGTNQFDADGSFRPADGPREISVLDRGEISQPLRPARPSTLSCVQGLVSASSNIDSQSESQRRAEFASWLANPDNGLMWRSIANRIWQYHFGNGLVDTPNDFGVSGGIPSHPQLLNWLASELQRTQGSLKSLQRSIVTSATYRQSSAHRPDAALLDTGNRLLWRMNRKRLDAESFRDSLLGLSGSLDSRMGGPSDQQFSQTAGVNVTPIVDYQGFDPLNRANFRRSVYRFIFRTLPDPFMDALDCPDASQLSPQRGESYTAVQTLATMNDKFVVHQCELLANVIGGSSPSATAPVSDQVAQLYQIVFCRAPTPDETSAVTAYIEKHGLANACRMLINTNEFMFVD